jgi:hypothetical protein
MSIARITAVVTAGANAAVSGHHSRKKNRL